MPTQIDRYRVKRLLGSGAFGRVYLAYDDRLQRDVAVKVAQVVRGERLPPQMFLEEAQALARLKHPRIVRVHEVNQDSAGQLFIVSEYAEGQSLDKLLKAGRLTLVESVKLVAAVAEALQHAHSKGIVHRDVKPANILIEGDGQPMLIDFGLALTTKSVGSGDEFAGTVAYMSPEQARGQGLRVDGRSDVFSLGIVLFELLAGRRPFEAETVEGLCDQIANVSARPVRQFDASLPLELDRICQKALERSLDRRYATAHDFAQDLQNFLGTAVEAVSMPVDATKYVSAGETKSTASAETSRREPVVEDSKSGKENDQLSQGRIEVAAPRRHVSASVKTSAAIVLGVLVCSALGLYATGQYPFNRATSGVANVATGKNGSTSPGFDNNSATESISAQMVEAVPMPPELRGTAAEPVLHVIFEESPASPQAPVAINFSAEILVKRGKDSDFQPLPARGSVASGVDHYVIPVTPWTKGYLYVVQVDSRGHVDWLFPKHSGSEYSSGQNPVQGEVVQIPSAELGPLYLNEDLGYEAVFVVVSATRWEKLEQVLADTVRKGADVEPARDSGVRVTRAPAVKTRGVGGTKMGAPTPATEIRRKEGLLKLSGTIFSGRSYFGVWSQTFEHVAPTP